MHALAAWPFDNDASRKVILCTDSAVFLGNDFELIPTVRMESQHSVRVPTSRDFPRFVFISEKSRGHKSELVDDVHAPFDLFGKKTPYRQIFSNVSERILGDIDPRLVCKFGEIWLTRNR